MTPWPEIDFSDLVSDETGGNAKTLQSDYLPEGTYPIVDQGQALIGGYTNDGSRVCKAELPVIVFGDHTKCFKYIDFPFCLGADGTKVLKPKRLLDERYLFYALQRIHIPDAGYSRHFKYLKEGRIPLPPPEVQKRIAEILDQADELRRKRQRALDRLNQLSQAIFIEMFGDPAINPMGWPIGTIRDLIGEAKYGTSAKANTDGIGLPILRMGNLTYDGKIDLSNLKHVELSDDEFDKYTTQPGDILFNRTNSKELVGKTAVVTLEEPLAIAGYLVRARANQRGNPHYISAYLNSAHGKTTLHNMCKNIVGMANINAQEFQNIAIALPPKEIQDDFAARLSSTEAARLPMAISQSKTESMFASLQARAFRGEL